MLRIVAALDGGICRVKLPGGVLHAAEARAIADAAARHASGVIEVTNRANLQIRGVLAGHEDALSEQLIEAGLGPAGAASRAATTSSLSALSAVDDVRNLMLSPSAGHDPHALFDTRPLAAKMLALLQSEARFAELSPKFALLLDGGEQLAMIEHPHDIWFAATSKPDGVRFAFGLAGCPPRHTSLAPETDAPRTTRAIAAVLPSQVPAVTNALLHAFLDLAAADHTRMRHLLALEPAETILQRAQTYLDFPLHLDPALAAWHRAPADATLRFGIQPQREAGLNQVGGQPLLSRLDSETLRALAAIAEDAGDATLRMTPWQSVLLPNVPDDASASTLTRLNALGLVTDATQPLARTIACAGSTGCAKSLADTKADALQLAAHGLHAAVAQVHLSGCPRSCAAAHRAPYTLLAVAPGRYDLYSDLPSRDDHAPGFGPCVARHLTIAEAAATLARLAGNPRSLLDA